MQPKSKILKFILATLGLISLGLGILGIFIPLLPTTPFLLLSTALFMRSSKRLHSWLQNYLLHKTISKKTKLSSLSLLWITIVASVLFVVEILIIKIVLLLIATAVTIHILSFKSENK